MPYQVLARKHRPQSFEDLFGQDAVAQTLKNSLASKKLAHAYLLFGPRGTGKTTTARILAKALNCVKGPTPTPCLKCDPCAEIAGGRAIDVLEIDAATHTQVDKVREVIIETVALAPARDRYKIFIIDEAHMLSASAFNALLKTLEEPPAHVVFMLATTEQHKIPATIFSRCQRYRFRPQGVPVIVEYLKKVAKIEKIEAEPKALEALARAADGSMRDAVSLLDQAVSFSDGPVKEAQVRELLGQLPEEALRDLARAALARDAAGLAKSFGAAVEEGQDPGALLKELRAAFHRMYTYRMGLGEIEKPWAAIADAAEPGALAFALKRLAKGVDELRGTDSARLAAELTLFGLIEPAHDLKDWVARLEALEQRLRSGTAAAATASVKTSPSAPHPPLSPSGRGVDFKAVWPRVVAAVAAQRPALGRWLESAQFEADGGKITLAFAGKLAYDSVQKEVAFIQQALQVTTGATAAIELRQDRDAAPTTLAPVAEAEAVRDEGPPEEPKKQGKWRPVSADDPLKADPGIQKALKVFQGKVYKPK